MTTSLIGGCRLIPLVRRGDERGSLVAIENKLSVPFNVGRVYYIYDTKEGVSRGHHSHRNLQQLLIAVNGSCVVTLDDGTKRQSVTLDQREIGLFIGPNVWREMSHFTPDCVLLVLADNPYDEADYIRDYDQFVREVSA